LLCRLLLLLLRLRLLLVLLLLKNRLGCSPR
jgi:hypothetical protein